MPDKLTILETMKMLNSVDFDESSEAEKIISLASQQALKDGARQSEVDEIVDYVMNDEEVEFKGMSLIEKAKEIKHHLEQYMLDHKVSVEDKEEEKRIKLMDSKEKTEAKGAIVPAGMGALAGRDEMSQKIVAKLMSVSKALADEFGYDQKMVLQDMINDLRIVGGEAIEDIVKGDTPIDQMTKEMATAFKGIGLDSNIALNFLLQMDEKEAVKQFREFLNKGGLLTNKENPKEIKQKENKEMKFLESFKQRLLVEAIDEIYTKYYSDVPREMFNKLIRLDPTFREEQDKLGDYGRWIITLFKQKKLKASEFENARENLFDFNERKRYLTTLPNGKDAKNIFNYAEIKDIRAALNNIQLTPNQIAKQARKAKHHIELGDEAELIAENDKWEIWSPKTHVASCKLGSQTRWCTAMTSTDSWFKNYTKNGKLYAFLPKDGDIKKKHQLQVIAGNEAGQFMDYNDVPVKFAKFIFDEKLLEILKQTELKNIDTILKIENMEKLARGEPLAYAGGTVDRDFLGSVKEIRFVKDYKETYIVGAAFANCINLETIYVPKHVSLWNPGCFKNCPKVTIYTPPHKISAFPADIEILKTKVKHIKESEMKYAD